jgi:FSR family fosmidomycin resistance protein-like MFS transporter
MSVFGTGGTIGIALGPILVTAFLGWFGLQGTLALVFPVSLMAALAIKELSALSPVSSRAISRTSGNSSRTDEWFPFLCLTGVVICRSIIFYTLNTFIPLYWVDVYGQSKASGGAALTILLSVGIAGQLLGGRLADRYGHRAVIRVGFGSLIPALLLFAGGRDITLSTLLLIPIGIATALSYSPMVVVGQRYLPGRMALSSGITLGLTVSAGGMIIPLLGRLADGYGLGTVFWVTAGVPVAATLLAFSLPLPKIDH